MRDKRFFRIDEIYEELEKVMELIECDVSLDVSDNDRGLRTKRISFELAVYNKKINEASLYAIIT